MALGDYLYEKFNKPPLGIVPRFIHDETRLGKITKAIYIYATSGREIPLEWIEEYNELIRRVKK